HVSPAAGEVIAVNRGAKRALMSVVIDVKGDDDTSNHREFSKKAKTAEDIRNLLKESGLWTALRTRPFSRVPDLESTPKSIFVTATDSNPLAPDPAVVLADRKEDFERGLAALGKLTEGPVYLCRAPGAAIEPGSSGAVVEEFGGKHPSGTVGYHIHVLDPVYRAKEVWHIGYQDVARIGATLKSGRLDVRRTVSLAGPAVKSPQLVSTRCGASVDELVADQVQGAARVISGSVFNGQVASGDFEGYLGAYANQVTVLEEGDQREFMGWLVPGIERFSVLPVFLSKLMPGKKFRFTTTTNGSPRAMVPIGMYEKVMPMDIMPTHMLRALCVQDVEWAEELGVLELDEEDLALCTFVDPGKQDFGVYLRSVLEKIQKEG
ncbi:MAG: Na(+)-translocating NADH-quinone reductase subunit A, partial [Myxococcota bacterium]